MILWGPRAVQALHHDANGRRCGGTGATFFCGQTNPPGHFHQNTPVEGAEKLRDRRCHVLIIFALIAAKTGVVGAWENSFLALSFAP